MENRSPGRAGSMFHIALWFCLLLYIAARFLQLCVGPISMLTVVILHVIPSAAFALLHGARTYRWKGILTFTALCLGIGCLFESLSLRTGFPFGHYTFTAVMGPKILDLPILLALAYVGMGYVSWTLALVILDNHNRPLKTIVATPLIASFLMVAWDLSMDPVWSTLDHAWIWRDGGAYFGVPVSNYLGWFLTVLLFYLLFARYLRAHPALPWPQPIAHWRMCVLFYTASAAGNLLLALAHPAYSVADATGKSWASSDIVGASVLISLFGMAPFALLAWIRLGDAQTTGLAASSDCNYI